MRENIGAIKKILTEQHDKVDVTALVKESHRIVNHAIRMREPGEDKAESLKFDRCWGGNERTKAEAALLTPENADPRLPSPPIKRDKKIAAANRVHVHVWQQGVTADIATPKPVA